MLIDTHAHLYHRRLAADLDEVLPRARNAGITRIIMPAIDVATIHEALELSRHHAGLYAMAALHPTDVKEATEADFAEVVRLCDDPRVVAVGETGLDYYWDRSFDARQQEYFRRHIRLATRLNLPLILHLRDQQNRDEVHRDVVQILREELPPRAKDAHRGIFHCFTGPAWLVEEALKLGFLLGIGGVLTFKNAGVDAIIKDVPLENLVLETDAPFMAPAPYRGKRNEPAYTRLVAERLAELKELPLDEIARVTTKNAERLFKIA